ncbi:hypothetical protein [Histophilus somni]|uniref:hypothetical protein n=1 Tax=Histophilus somni TaxID=731 RepID=UPI0018EB51FA|nr:hypothetical protein [Histophilus somni]QQF78456.1 hypothetical protein JFL53_08020 [Histophilus somni]
MVLLSKLVQTGSKVNVNNDGISLTPQKDVVSLKVADGEDGQKKVVIKAEPTATPIGISNVASGLGPIYT